MHLNRHRHSDLIAVKCYQTDIVNFRKKVLKLTCLILRACTYTGGTNAGSELLDVNSKCCCNNE